MRPRSSPNATPTGGDSLQRLSDLLRRRGITPEAWYGVRLFSDRVDLPLDGTDVAAAAEVELRASLQDPYRQLSRSLHLLGRSPDGDPDVDARDRPGPRSRRSAGTGRCAAPVPADRSQG